MAPCPAWYGASKEVASSDESRLSFTWRRDDGAGASAGGYPCTEEGLTREVLDFARHVSLHADDIAIREALLQDVQACVQRLWPEGDGAVETARVIVYGSFALGLSIVSSDVDLTISFSSCAPPAVGAESGAADEAERAGRQLARLYQLAGGLTQFPHLRVRVMDQCRVPLLHVRDLRSGLSCDVNTTLMAEAEAVVRRQRAWLQQEPVAAPLIVVTKAALRQWGLNSVFSGGVSSTALYSLLYRFLWQERQRVMELAQHEGTASLRKLSERAEQGVMTAHWGFSGASGEVAKTSTDSDSVSVVETSEEVECSTLTPTPPPPYTAAPSEWRLAAPSVTGAVAEDGSSTTTSTASPGSLVKADKDEEDDAGTERGHTATASVTTTVVGSPTTSVRSEQSFPPVAVVWSGSSTSLSTLNEPATLASSSALSTSDAHAGANPLCKGEGEQDVATLCQQVYGVSLGRLLLQFWRCLSDEAFLTGFDIPDLFASTDAATKDALSLYSTTSGATDLTVASYRLPDLLALLRHSSTTVNERLSLYHHLSRDGAPSLPEANDSEKGSGAAVPVHRMPAFRLQPPMVSLLSTVLVDPRTVRVDTR